MTLALGGIVALVLVAMSAPALQAQPSSVTLDEVVARVLDRNVAVEAARHRVDVARAGQIAAGLHPDPTLTISAENLRVSGPTPAGDLYEVGVTYSQPIERSDKRRSRRDVANAAVAVGEAELAEALGQRLFEAKRAFYETLLARHGAEQAADNARAFDELVRITEARFKEGVVAEGEVVKVRLEQMRLHNAAASAALASRQAGIRLLDLLGETDFARAGAVTGALVAPPVTPGDAEGLKAVALQRRPGVRAAELAIALAERRTELERAHSTADVSPFLGVRRVGENNTVLLGIAIPLPLMDRNQGGIARAIAEERGARAEATLRRTRVLAEVESAYQAWQSARQRMTAFESNLLRQADESQTIALRAYQEGAAELLAYLEAQRTRNDIRGQYLQTVFDAWVALSSLEHATGQVFER